LKTADIDAARERAFDQDADLRFRIKHEVPIFNRPFSQIAKDYADLQKDRVEAGQIAKHRCEVVESIIKAHLNPYVGSVQINLIGQDRRVSYPLWRQKNGKGRNGRVSDASIRTEMSIFRSIMAYAASKKYINENQVFKGKIPLAKVRREEFTPEEYRKLPSRGDGSSRRESPSRPGIARSPINSF
jgi:integrase